MNAALISDMMNTSNVDTVQIIVSTNELSTTRIVALCILSIAALIIFISAFFIQD